VLLRLLPGETVVGATAAGSNSCVVMASKSGYITRIAVSSLRPCLRGDLGQISARLAKRGDQWVDLRVDRQSIIGILLDSGRSQRIHTAEMNNQGSEEASPALTLTLDQRESIVELVQLVDR